MVWYLAQIQQHIDNHTEVNHAVAHCSSDEYYKTILDDRARGVFRGRIIVAQDAQLSNADQQNNNLLLSKNAEADSKPQLEIYADDVKCSHGATVGQLEPKSVFYLQSRGIDQKSATALLTFAFANEVIERIKLEPIRTELTELIAGQLLSGLEELVWLTALNTAPATFDIERIRADFPILHKPVSGHPLVYLDNGASTQKPQSVIDAISAYYQNDNANVHRGIHELSQRATDKFEAARAAVQQFINADSEAEIIFTSGTNWSHQPGCPQLCSG